MPQNTPFSTAEHHRACLRKDLDEMLGLASWHKLLVTRFEQLRLLLGALPLDSTAFALAVNRLANARHYLEYAEYGAARYELRLLRRSLD